MEALAVLGRLGLGGLKGVGAGFAWLFADARRWLSALLAIACLLAWHEHTGKLQCHADFAAYKVAQADASARNAAAQKKANDDQKAKFNHSAEKADVAYPNKLAGNRDAAAVYRAAHRVQPGTAGFGPGAAAAQGDVAGVPQDPATDAELVAVTGGDFDTCTVDHTYAKALYDWGRDLVAQGAAEYAPDPPASDAIRGIGQQERP